MTKAGDNSQINWRAHSNNVSASETQTSEFKPGFNNFNFARGNGNNRGNPNNRGNYRSRGRYEYNNSYGSHSLDKF
jgi:hypothetical protein